MSPEKQEILFARYPGIFRDRTKPMTESCMHWGIEVGDGWFDLLNALCEAINKPYSGSVRAVEDGSDEGFEYEFPQVVADQVKEKYGTLRFYSHLDLGPEWDDRRARFPKTVATLMARFSAYVDGAIGMAEALSARTCESTGELAEMHVKDGWYATMSRAEGVKRGFVPVSELKKP